MCLCALVAKVFMQEILSKINTQSEAFKANYRKMLVSVEKLEDLMEKSAWQGEEKYIEQARKSGKLLARERIELLLDRDSPYLDLLPLAGYGRKCFTLGGTMAAGIGLVSNKLCLIIANIATIKGGAIDYVTLQKAMRLNEIAMENRLPAIYLVESAGANLPEQAKIFNYGGTNFREITRRSKEGIPTISVVFGNSTAGGAYIPGMSDYVIMVKNQAKVFLAGPPLVKMATGEVVDDESLGGAETHSKISGVSDFLAENEHDAIRIARDIMAILKCNTVQRAMRYAPCAMHSDEILGIVSEDVMKPYDVREIIARIVDGSKFLEFKPGYGTTLVTGYSYIHGQQVGIIANNGVLFSEAANKGAHFIQLCNKNDTPLLFLQNITGFMVGRKYEHGGIIKDGAKMINAVSNSTVPAITVIIGASYGAGNYAMCGRAFQPRFLFSWPNSKIAVMGVEQLTGVMEIIQKQAKKTDLLKAAKGKIAKAKMTSDIEEQSSAFYATGQLWDDGVIDPRQTRNYLGICLEVIYNSPFKGTNEYGVFRM